MLGITNVLPLALTIASSCIAHMILENPKPYGLATLNNSPLDGSGLDFPCKQREGVYDLTQMNHWKAGERQVISFKGSAVHGGGSCQFSVTTDLQPTKSSQWKVIRSVIGGCPASADGNLEPNQHASTFDLALPEDMPSGEYTFAWTWFNRLGVREMYMNCAPISVSSDGNDTTFFDRLPNMFVANLPSTACATPENFDYSFPEPGEFTTTGTGAKLATTLIGTGCASVTRLGAGAGTMRAHETIATDASDHRSNPSVAIAAVNPPTHSEEGTESKTMSVAGPSVATPSIVGLATPVANINALPSVLPPSCVDCNDEGAVVCIGKRYFGICSNGCAYRQPVAAGTFCTNGVIAKRNKA